MTHLRDIKTAAKIQKVTFRQAIGLVSLGVVLFFVILEIGLRLGGVVILSLQDRRNSASIRREGSYRILCLGESTTQRGYPPALEVVLNGRRSGISFSVVNGGIAGVDSEDILTDLKSNLDRCRPAMVILMMGINDKAEYMPYGEFPRKGVRRFAESLRCYKLMRLLGAHVKAVLEKRASDEISASEQDEQKATGRVSGSNRAQGLVGGVPAQLVTYRDYLDLADAYQRQDNQTARAQTLKKAIQLGPSKDEAYSLLGQCYGRMEEFQLSVDALIQAIAVNPDNAESYRHLGKTLQEAKRYPEAEAALKQAIAHDPAYYDAYFWLGMVYQLWGKFAPSEEAFKKAMGLQPQISKTYGNLGMLYEEMGDPVLAERYFRKARELKAGYIPATIVNYRKLKRVLDERGIALVCVQYPMREIGPLKEIFEGESGIVFVDNGKIFRDAVKRGGYRRYFVDIFAGDFGHCTPQGNRMLAENIAGAVFKRLGIEPVPAQGASDPGVA
jgi:tetratricopeptide (TPR) repeat protein